MTTAILRAQQTLARLTPAAPRWAARAPGRVNLIGEHTDYSGGFVLPMAIDRHTVALAAPRSDSLIRIASADADSTALAESGSAISPDPALRGTFPAYALGVIEQLRRRGVIMPPADIALASDVPLGAGLSSSASLEVALATLAELAADRALHPNDKANACRLAEHEFAGVPCGIMDQLIAVLGRQGHALLIDCLAELAHPVPIPPSIRVLVINTRVKHSLAAGEYAQRRLACVQAARALDISLLRDADAHGGLSFVERRRARLSPDQYRAARHVVGENQRTQDAARALTAGDLAALGPLLRESHASLRDDFRVSCPELDFTADFANATPGVVGARMTGGGFGGCVVALATPDAAQALAHSLPDAFASRFSIRPDLFQASPAQGASSLPLA
jgi:galactokinase